VIVVIVQQTEERGEVACSGEAGSEERHGGFVVEVVNVKEDNRKRWFVAYDFTLYVWFEMRMLDGRVMMGAFID
jgi:hypothetical protein